jgi:hypothetical protein
MSRPTQARAANATPPALFERRRVRLHSEWLPMRGAERREAHLGNRRTLRRGCALGEGRSPFGAPLAAIFHLGTVASATRADFFGAPSAGISPRSPCHVQPTEGRPLVVGADGDPRRPGRCVRDTSRAPHQPFSVARSRPSGGLAGPYLRSQPPIRSTFRIASRRRPSKSRVRRIYVYLPRSSRIIFQPIPRPRGELEIVIPAAPEDERASL